MCTISTVQGHKVQRQVEEIFDLAARSLIEHGHRQPIQFQQIRAATLVGRKLKSLATHHQVDTSKNLPNSIVF